MHNELHGSASPRAIQLRVGDILGEPHDFTFEKAQSWCDVDGALQEWTGHPCQFHVL